MAEIHAHFIKYFKIQLLLKRMSSWTKDKSKLILVDVQIFHYCTCSVCTVRVTNPLKTSSSRRFGVQGRLINSWCNSCVEHHARKKMHLRGSVISTVTLNLWQRINVKRQQSVLSFLFHVLKCCGNITAGVLSPHRSSVHQLTFSPVTFLPKNIIKKTEVIC